MISLMQALHSIIDRPLIKAHLLRWPARLLLDVRSSTPASYRVGQPCSWTLSQKPLFVCILLFSLLYSPVAFGVVYMKPKDVLTQFFNNSEKVVSEKKQVGAIQRAELSQRLGYKFKEKELIFYVGKTGAKIDGYALLDHQIGKTQPITFMTLIGPKGRVEQIEVLVYRESHGSEVRHQRFLKQFYTKVSSDPLRRGRDIVNISGATMSVDAMTVGVKRALILWNYYFGNE